ncbi:MAG: M28 family peptidase [Muribaculaceae bacterium]|nr:M28 family peptidase [Muribaculaceae bacterium]
MKTINILLGSMILFLSCGGKATASRDTSEDAAEEETVKAVKFSADSAYSYLATQVDFGPRVPNSEAHRRAGDWLVAELSRHGAKVTEQKADLKAFDGTTLHARNIFGQFNPDAPERILLLAHYDCRPWADQDPDPEKRKLPVDGANDGASGVAVLLEVARQLKLEGSKTGVDILFVDAEDWGTDGDDDSWAMGARYFAQNPVIPAYSPDFAILLDMVGGKDARFPREYFSQQNAGPLNDAFWSAARKAGHAERFPNSIGGAVTDDHLEFLKVGIPAIDIIEYNQDSGFNPTWHTSADNLSNISKETLGAVGESLMIFLSQASR